MICKEVEELAGVYALGALPADSMKDVEEHLLSCSRHPDIAQLSDVARSLALAAPRRLIICRPFVARRGDKPR